MSKPRISIELEVDTLSHAQTIATAITNRIDGKDIFHNHGVTAYSDGLSNKIRVRAEIRFNGRIDRDDAMDWLKDQVQKDPRVKVWVQSAKVVTHLCSHDDAEVKSCKTTEFFEWER